MELRQRHLYPKYTRSLQITTIHTLTDQSQQHDQESTNRKSIKSTIDPKRTRRATLSLYEGIKKVLTLHQNRDQQTVLLQHGRYLLAGVRQVARRPS